MSSAKCHCAGLVFHTECEECRRRTDEPNALSTMRGIIIDGRCSYRLRPKVEITNLKELQNDTRYD